MKKVLSIVLALAMVLCMIPALAADVTTTKLVENNSYFLDIVNYNNTVCLKDGGNASNSLTYEYKWSEIKDDNKVSTGKWTENKVMALVSVSGFQSDNGEIQKVLINNKELTVSQNAEYYDVVKEKAFGTDSHGAYLLFPVELTEEGYSETYYVSVISKITDSANANKGLVTTETAKISLTFKNTDDIKSTKDAYITNIAMHKCDDHDDTEKATTYIVGDKIYVDFPKKAETVKIDFTFADENKAPFTGITYAVTAKDSAGTQAKRLELEKDDPHTRTFTDDGTYAKLNNSVGTFIYVPKPVVDEGNFWFALETEQAKYKTKKYSIVYNEDVHEADPKGVYLDKSEVTIAVGEEYTPVIKAISNGANLNPTAIEITSGKDIVDKTKASATKLIGVKPGVAYIKVTYAKDYRTYGFGEHWSYTSSAQKITVTLPGQSIPTQTTDYVVTCRNLNVRKGAGTSFGKTGMAHRGEVLKVVEIANGWAKLADGTYVCAKYITK